MQNKAGQKLREFCQDNALASSRNATGDSIHEHHLKLSTKNRLIAIFAAKDEAAPYNQQKQDQEQTVAQILNSLLQNSDLN